MKSFWGKATSEILTGISAYHEKNPLKSGFIKEELRSRTTGSTNQRLFNFIVNQQIKKGVIVQENELLRMKDHRVTLASDQKEMREHIEQAYLKGRLQPPHFKDVSKDFPDGEGTDILAVLLKDGVLLKIKEDLYFHSTPVEELKNKVIDFLKKNGELNTAQLKEMTGTSRKYTIPLIEYFDHEQITVRVGDSRVLRKKI